MGTPTLYGLDPSGELYTINTSTGQIASDVGNTGVRDSSLVGLAGSSLYLTSTTPSGGHLFLINLSTGNGTDLGQLADPLISQTFTDVFGVAFDSDNGVLYGYDVSDNQFQINTGNPGQSTLNDATFVEPSTFVLIGSGLLLLAAGLRKAKQTV